MKASALTPEFYKEHREKVVEYIAEHDDAILTKYLEQHKLEPAELRASLRRSTIALKLVPVMAGSAFKNKGIQPLLDAVVDYLPSPVDVPPVEGTTTGRTEPELRRASDDQPFAALAFKIMTDPYVGHLTYIRVYSGVLKTGQSVYNSTKKTRERIGRLLRMHANKREEIESIEAGDIAACVGLKNVTTGDTLCERRKADRPRNHRFSHPGYFRSDRTQDQSGSGKNGHRARKAGAGRSDVPRAHGPGYRPNADFRAWASCTSKSSSTA